MWYTGWLEALRHGMTRFAGSLPTIVGSLLLVLCGWLLARILARWARKTTTRLLSKLESKSTIGTAIDASGTRAVTPVFVGIVVFWTVLLVFVAAAVEIVGLPVVTELIGRVAVYVPNIVAAAGVLLAGLVLAGLARSAVVQAAQKARIAQPPAVGFVVHGVIVLMAAVIALEQLGINGRVLEMTIAVTIGSVLAAVALAFGLGARGSVANLIAARYAAQLCRVGQTISIDGIDGTVVEIGPTAVVLESGDSKLVVPATRFQETTVVLPRGES